jgi:hypothetical protein
MLQSIVGDGAGRHWHQRYRLVAALELISFRFFDRLVLIIYLPCPRFSTWRLFLPMYAINAAVLWISGMSICVVGSRNWSVPCNCVEVWRSPIWINNKVTGNPHVTLCYSSLSPPTMSRRLYLGSMFPSFSFDKTSFMRIMYPRTPCWGSHGWRPGIFQGLWTYHWLSCHDWYAVD